MNRFLSHFRFSPKLFAEWMGTALWFLTFEPGLADKYNGEEYLVRLAILVVFSVLAVSYVVNGIRWKAEEEESNKK